MGKVPPEIRILSEDVANKIAAGEVVERPAAAVKELLENSIDAGATRIEVEFSRGGKSLIKVSDNGCGMTRQQALMSLEPHATSKIRKSEDIFSISSYGFRGEAVPSIASVSSFTMRTRPEAESFGTEVRVEAGTVGAVRECGMACGTEISVENLFAAVPARRKFLKSDNVEASHIIRLCRLYALALPEISITLIENARVVFRSSANLGVVERVKRVFGAEISAKLVPLERVQCGEMSVSGAIVEPGESFPTSRNICAFINSRPVESKAVYSAVKEAYASFVPKGRYAAAFLFINLPYESVDVNVHPSKREVRLRDEFGVRDFLMGAISNRLKEFLSDRAGYAPRAQDADFSAAVDAAEKKLFPKFTPDSFGTPERAPDFVSEKRAKLPYIPSIADTADAVAEASSLPCEDSDSDDFSPQPAALQNTAPRRYSRPIGAETASGMRVAEDSSEEQPLESSAEENGASAVAELPPEAASSAPPRRAAAPDGWRYIGCAAKKYAMFETRSGVEIVNISAALRRIAYTRVIDGLGGAAVQSQMLLIPVSLTLDRADAEALEANLKSFAACGFSIEHFGGSVYRISAVPSWLDFSRVESFAADFVAVAREGTSRAKTLSREAFARAVSARESAANFVCSEANACALLGDLLACPSYASSPDGKPAVRELSSADLARMFNLNR